MDKFVVLCQPWESRKGLKSKDDGYSIHLDKNHLDNFMEKYWQSVDLHKNFESISRPYGNAKLILVDQDIYDMIKDKNGCRFFEEIPTSDNVEVLLQIIQNLIISKNLSEDFYSGHCFNKLKEALKFL